MNCSLLCSDLIRFFRLNIPILKITARLIFSDEGCFSGVEHKGYFIVGKKLGLYKKRGDMLGLYVTV